MKAKAGPWTAEFSAYGGYDCMTAAWVIRDASGLGIVTDVDCNERGHANSPQAEANAKLIAAAPELLEACKAVVELLDNKFLVRNTENDGEPDFAARQIQPIMKLALLPKAIAKAEGA